MTDHSPLVRRFEVADLEDAYQLLSANGWAHRISDPLFLERLVSGSQCVVVAISKDKIIGFARAITDGLSNGYLSMVVVAPEWRGRGVGRRLVEEILGSAEGITWVLRASRSQAPDFFSKLGFVPSSDAMERVRKRASGS